jgi:hypothetical protein
MMSEFNNLQIFQPLGRALILFFLLLTCKNAFSQNVLSGDGILATSFTNAPEIKAVIWKYNGQLSYLNSKLKAVRETSFGGSNIIEISPYSNGLLAIIEPKDKESTDTITQVVDIDPYGEIRNTWSTNSFIFWSVAYDNDEYISTNSEGELIRLESTLKQIKIGQYPDASIVLSVPNSDRLICTLPNLTKANYSPAFCQGSNWSERGEWRDILRPFICKGYLIEPSGGWRDAPVKQLLVRSVKTGQVVSQKPVARIESANCTDGKLIYTSEVVNVLSLPNLETLKRSECGSPDPISATLINNNVICLDKHGKLHTD